MKKTFPQNFKKNSSSPGTIVKKIEGQKPLSSEAKKILTGTNNNRPVFHTSHMNRSNFIRD